MTGNMFGMSLPDTVSYDFDLNHKDQKFTRLVSFAKTSFCFDFNSQLFFFIFSFKNFRHSRLLKFSGYRNQEN